jgi:hypothetical protein
VSPSIADNEAFVTLLHVAREDADVRRQLVALLELEPFHRRSALNTTVERMRLQGAPIEFINAVSALTDDRIADRARELLNGMEK